MPDMIIDCEVIFIEDY